MFRYYDVTTDELDAVKGWEDRTSDNDDLGSYDGNPLDDIDGNPLDNDVPSDNGSWDNKAHEYNDENPSDDDDGNPLDDEDGNPIDHTPPDHDEPTTDDPTTDEDEQTDDDDEIADNDGHNNTDYPSDDDEPSADALNDHNYNGYDNAGYDDEYDNIFKDYDDDYNDDHYEDDDSCDDNGCHSHNNHSYIGFDDIEDIDKIVRECERDLHLLWDTFLSLTSHTFIGHQPSKPVRTTTSPQPFKLVGPTSPGGVLSTPTGRVHCGRHQIYKLIGITPPPPKVSRYNQQHLRLHTGQRHGPRAPTTHLVMIFSCGSRHQPRAPDHRSMELPLKHPHHWYEMFFFDTWLV